MLLRSKVTLILALIFLAFLISRLVGFLRIFGEHAGIRITQEQIALAYTVTIPDNRPQVIPKIIHQVFHDWKNESMPADWDAVRQTCISMNEDWEYMVCQILGDPEHVNNFKFNRQRSRNAILN